MLSLSIYREFLLLFLLVFTGPFVLFRRVTGSSPLHNMTFLMITSLAGLIIFLSVLISHTESFTAHRYANYPNREFAQEQWLNNKSTRFELSEDLLNRKILAGKTNREILTLLGRPDMSGPNTYYYDLGYRPINVYPEMSVLELTFEGGLVSTIFVHHP